MIMLDGLCRDILVLLLQSQRPMSSSHIASKLNTTARVVYYNLSRVQKWLASKGVRLVKKPGYGVFIDASTPVLRSLLSELEEPAVYRPFSSSERWRLLTLWLLKSDGPLVIKQFEQLLNVSRVTVRRDLEKVGRWLEQHNLRLFKRSHVGLRIVGSEHDLRQAIVAFLMENVDEAYLVALCRRGKRAACSHKQTKDGFWQALSSFLKTLELRYAQVLTASIENMLNVRFTDTSHVALVLHLAILIWRAQKGKSIEVGPESLHNFAQRKEFSVARIIAERIDRWFSLSLPESEVAYIAMLCLGTEPRNTIFDTVNETSFGDTIDKEVHEIVEGVLAKASVYLHPALRVDPELAYGLTSYFASAINRLMFSLRMRNPLLEDVKRRYPYVFEVARKSCVVLGERIAKQVPEEEIGYVAMHLVAAMERLGSLEWVRTRALVICSMGISTAWLLVSRIRAEFPQLQIVGVKSSLELSTARDFSDIDLVISTIPIDIDAPNIPVIVVNPFLDREDVKKLRRFLGTQDSSIDLSISGIPYEGGGVSLSNLLTPATVMVKVSACSWQEMVYRAGKPLLDIGAIESRYIDAMREIIIRYGPYMVFWPGIVLLHALPEDGVKRLCMSLVTSAQPIYFGHVDNDPVDIAIVLGAVDKYSHLRALSELQELVENEQIVCRIRQASAKEQILDVFASLTHQ